MNWPESCKEEQVWLLVPTPIAVSTDLIIRKWQEFTCFLSFRQICFTEASGDCYCRKAWKSPWGFRGWSRKGLWVFIVPSKSHSILKVWLEWVQCGKVWMEIFFCARIFCKNTVHNIYQVSKYNKAKSTPACVHISCCEFWILNSILSRILPI